MTSRADGPDAEGSAFVALFRNRQFARVAASDALSGAGDVLYWVALIVLLLERDGGGALVAAAVVARLVPRVAFGTLGGVIADRYDRRTLLMSLDGARAILMFLLAAAASTNSPAVVVLGLVFVTCTLSTPYRPAISAGYPLLVGERHLAAANAVSSTIGQVSSLTGPLLGAVLLTVGAPPLSFVVNGCTYIGSVILLAGVRGLGAPETPRNGDARTSSWRGELASGVRAVSGNDGLAALMLLVASVMLLRGFELVLHVQVADVVLRLGPSGYGLISAALGAGALAAAPFTGRLAGSRHPGAVLVGSVLVGCSPLAVLAVADSFTLAMVVLAVQGASIVSFEVVALTMLQRACKTEVLGRVLGMQNTLSGSAKLTGSLLAPVLVVSFGLSGALFVAATLAGLLAVVLAPRVMDMGRASAAVLDTLEPIVAVLDRLGVFDGASRTALERLAMNVEVCAVEAGAIVVREGDRADDFYIIRSGEFVVESFGVQVNTLGPSHWFGEIGLLRRAARTATVEALTPAVLWRIPGHVFLAAVTSSPLLPEQLTDGIEERLARSEAVRPVLD